MAGSPGARPFRDFVHNGRFDIQYANPLAAALYSEHFRDQVRPPNSARFLFLDPRARALYDDWEAAANDIVATLRGEAGRNPYDRALSDLVGPLFTRSEEFRVRWAGHDVRFRRSGTKRFHHPLVGDLTLAFEALELPADPGLVIVTYSAEPGSGPRRGSASSSAGAGPVRGSWPLMPPPRTKLERSGSACGTARLGETMTFDLIPTWWSQWTCGIDSRCGRIAVQLMSCLLAGRSSSLSRSCWLPADPALRPPRLPLDRPPLPGPRPSRPARPAGRPH